MLDDRNKKRHRFELLITGDDYDFLSWMLHRYNVKDRSVAARVCIRMVREWERQRGNYPPSYKDPGAADPIPQNGKLTVAKMQPGDPEA